MTDLPQAAGDIERLGRIAYETWQRERGVPGDALWDAMPPAAQGAWRVTAQTVAEAAAPPIAAAERARLYAELGNEHYVIFTEDGWTVEHSVECRLSGHMHECGYHTAIREIADEYDPGSDGRWRITGIDSEGLPSLERTGMPEPKGDPHA